MFVIASIGAVLLLNSNQNNKSNTTEESEQTQIQDSSKIDEIKNYGYFDESINVVDKACSVFSPQDIFKAFGITVGEGKEIFSSQTGDRLPFVSCEWVQSEEEAGSAAKTYSIQLEVYNSTSKESAKQELDESRIKLGNLNYEEISGLADGAIFARGATGLNQVQAMIKWVKDNVVYTLTAVRLDGINQSQYEQKLRALVKMKF